MNASKPNAPIEPRILGQLLLLQSAIEAIVDKETLREAVDKGLSEIPGASACRMRLSDSGEPSGTDLRPDRDQVFLIRSLDRIYGEIHFHVTDHNDFAPYLPFIQNLVGFIALVLQNRSMAANQKCLTERFESLYRERTAALSESEHRFHSIFNSSSRIIGLLDAEGRILEANEAALALAGRQPSELIGLPLDKTHWWQNDKVSAQRVRHGIDLAAAGEDLSLTIQLEGSSGPETVELSFRPISTDDDVVTQIVFEGLIITARLSAELNLTSAMDELQRNNKAARIVSTAAASMLGAGSESASAAITDILAQSAQYCGADRAHLFLISGDQQRVTNTHEWCAPGVPAVIHQIQNEPINSIPWLIQETAEQPLIIIDDVAALPLEAFAEKSIFRSEQSQSLVICSLLRDGKCIGFVDLHAVHEKRTWNDHETSLLRLLADVLSSGVARWHSERDLAASEERLRLAFQASSEGLWDFNVITGIVWWNETYNALYGARPSESNKGLVWWLAHVHPEDRDRVERSISDALSGDATLWLCEYRFVRDDGQVIDVLDRATISHAPDGRIQRMLGCMLDVTDHKKATQLAESASAQANQLLEEAELTRRSLLSILEDQKMADAALRISETRYRELIDNLSDGVAVYEPIENGNDFIFREINRAGAQLGGIDREQAIGKTISDVFPYVRELGLIEVFRRVLESGQPEHHPVHLYEDDRLELWVENYVYRLPSGEIVSVYNDVSDQKRAEERRRLTNRVFEYTAEGLVITDADANIVYTNPAFSRITGYSEQEVLGQNPRFLNSGRADTNFFRDMWLQLGSEGHWRGELWNRRKNGDIYPEWLTISSVTNEEQALTHYVGIFSDISHLKEAQEKLDFLAHHDALTSLPNRNLFHDRLIHAIERARRRQRSIAVLFMDLDRFKAVNDTLGHPIGDKLLIDVSRRILGVVRQADTFARLGGDEFVLLLEEYDRPSQVVSVARKLLELFEENFTVDGHQLAVSSSIGISLYPNDGNDADTLIRHADRAMYEAKREGRNTFHFYTPTLTAGAYERLTMEADLRKAIRDHQFELHYQPQVDLGTGKLRSVEALVRWNHPVKGLVLPLEFIPLAEELGLINDIGSWVLNEACLQMRKWDDLGFHIPKVAVNLSVQQLDRDGFVELVRTVLNDAGISARRLELEVTESILMRDPDVSRRTLMGLKTIGLSIAVDDFGTGYSNLAYLKKLPLDSLKIDRSFVEDIGQDQNSEAIVQATIALANSLKLETIAEGIERNVQVEFLAKEGATFGQGFLFETALNADKLHTRWRP